LNVSELLADGIACVNFDEPAAQVDGGIGRSEAVGVGAQVQSITGAAALEAVAGVLFKVDREAAAGTGAFR
jgi:hypothetical protein